MVTARSGLARTISVPPLEVQRRPLTREEATDIVLAIQDTPRITGYSIAEWRGRRDTFVLIDPNTGNLIAALLIHHLIGGWSELAVVFVMPEYRGNGHAAHLVATTLRTVAPSERNLVLFFSDDVMRRLVERLGFITYESIEELAGARRRVGLLLGWLYDVQWLSSGYRLREIRRKRREMGLNLNFKVAVLAGASLRDSGHWKGAVR